MKTFEALFAELSAKAKAGDSASGTVQELAKGVHFIGKKLVEEASESWMAAEYEGDERTAEELSQLLTSLSAQAESSSVSEIYDTLLVRSGYLPALEEQNTVESEGRIENLLEFKSVISEKENEAEANGEPLTLQNFMEGLALISDIDNHDPDQDAVNLYERVKRGDVSQCSFGFDILDEEPEFLDNGLAVWHLRRVELFEISVCTFPAYKDTGVEARQAEVEHERQRKLETWRAEALARVKGASPEKEA